MSTIRRVQPEDILSVSTLAYNTLPERYNPAIFNQFYESYCEGFFVALHQQTIIGFIIGIKITPNIARILMFSVNEQYRKQGIGSALLLRFLREMKNLHVTRVELEVRTTDHGALSFYKKKGFRTQEIIRQFYQNGEDAYCMRKEL